MLPRPGLILSLALLFPLCITQSTNNGNDNDNLSCTPGEICERCPDEALHQPYCQPFGNRRLIYCKKTLSAGVPQDFSPTTHTKDDTDTDVAKDTRPHYAQRLPSLIDFSPSPLAQGSHDSDRDLILGWESCGRVVSTERADFFEFIAVNLLFTCISVGLVIWRSRRLRLLHARQLAARIGMIGRQR